MSGDLHCKCCGWFGGSGALYAGRCPVCAPAGCDDSAVWNGDDTPYQPVAAIAPPSILDAAIAASSALDPLGSRKSAEALRVPSTEEREAERKRVAERIASMGRVSC